MTKPKEAISIPEPNFQYRKFTIIGTSPMVMHKFSAKTEKGLREKQEAGSTAKKGKNKDARNFDQEVKDATHYSTEGWAGIPASAFRNAMISACRTIGFKMTLAKLAVFIESCGLDRTEHIPLVKITKGEPHRYDNMGRTETGVVMPVSRPMWDPGWEAEVTVRYDGDIFTEKDVANLLLRVGQQVGILEGRPDSSNSAGMGWGLFRLKTKERKDAA